MEASRGLGPMRGQEVSKGGWRQSERAWGQ